MHGDTEQVALCYEALEEDDEDARAECVRVLLDFRREAE